MRFSERIQFESGPTAVRRAISGYVARRFPRASDVIQWDPSGRRATGSKMGASGTLMLSGTGPTTLEISAVVGLPASLLITKAKVRKYLREAITDLKKTTP
jgi:hypothetical protein